ncbi:MAG TPA: DUF2624 family protein [Bacillales bacterium]
MNPFVKQMINHKINSITSEQLYQLGEQYNTPISRNQAKQIAAILHEQTVDIVDETQRKRIISRIAREVSPGVAKKIKTLLEVFL